MSSQEELENSILQRATQLKVSNQLDLERLLTLASSQNNRDDFLAYVDLQNKIEQYLNCYNINLFHKLKKPKSQKTRGPKNTPTPPSSSSPHAQSKRNKKKKNTHSNPQLAQQAPTHHPPSLHPSTSSPIIYSSSSNPFPQPLYHPAPSPSPFPQQAYDPSNPSPFPSPQPFTHYQPLPSSSNPPSHQNPATFQPNTVSSSQQPQSTTYQATYLSPFPPQQSSQPTFSPQTQPFPSPQQPQSTTYQAQPTYTGQGSFPGQFQEAPSSHQAQPTTYQAQPTFPGQAQPTTYQAQPTFPSQAQTTTYQAQPTFPSQAQAAFPGQAQPTTYQAQPTFPSQAQPTTYQAQPTFPGQAQPTTYQAQATFSGQAQATFPGQAQAQATFPGQAQAQATFPGQAQAFPSTMQGSYPTQFSSSQAQSQVYAQTTYQAPSQSTFPVQQAFQASQGNFTVQANTTQPQATQQYQPQVQYQIVHPQGQNTAVYQVQGQQQPFPQSNQPGFTVSQPQGYPPQQQPAGGYPQQGYIQQYQPTAQGFIANHAGHTNVEEDRFPKGQEEYMKENGIIEQIESNYEVSIQFQKGKAIITTNSDQGLQGNIEAAKTELMKEKKRIVEGKYPLSTNIKLNGTVNERITKKLREEFPKNTIETCFVKNRNQNNFKKNKNQNKNKKGEIIYWGTNDEHKEIEKYIQEITKIHKIVVELDKQQIKQMEVSRYILPNNESMKVHTNEASSSLEISTIFPELVDKQRIQQHINKTLKISEEMDFDTLYVNRKGLMDYIKDSKDNEDDQGASHIQHYLNTLNQTFTTSIDHFNLSLEQTIDRIPFNKVKLKDAKQYLKHSRINKDAERIGVSYSFLPLQAGPNPTPAAAYPNNRSSNKLTITGTKDKLDEFKTTKSYRTLTSIISVPLSQIIPTTLLNIWDDNEIEEIITEMDLLVVEVTPFQNTRNQQGNKAKKNNKMQSNSKMKVIYGTAEQIRKFVMKIRRIIKEREYVMEKKTFTELNSKDWIELKNRLLSDGAKGKKMIEEQFGVAIFIEKGNDSREMQLTGKQSDVDSVFEYLESSQKKATCSIIITNKLLLQILKKKDFHLPFCKNLGNSYSGY